MKTVEMSEATGPLSEYAGRAHHETLVVTEDGKPVAALMPIEEVDLESLSLSTNSARYAVRFWGEPPRSFQETRLYFPETGRLRLRSPGTRSGPLQHAPADFSNVFSRQTLFFPFSHCFSGKNIV